MSSDIAIQIKDISKRYKLYNKPFDRVKESFNIFSHKCYHKEFYALKNINLDIKKGEVLGIVGINGAGKSTLLKIIAGVLTPSSGSLNVQGELNAILELSSSLKGEMTGRENITLNLQIKSVMQERAKIIADIIEFAGIGLYMDQPVKTYSSGMKARLGFAIAISTNPDILIVDEVLAVGDILFQRKCYAKIERLFKDGKTVIFVSHSIQSIIEFCTRAVLLYNREIILDGTPKQVTDYYQQLVFSKEHDKILDTIKGIEKNKKQVACQNKVLENDETFYLPELRSNAIEYKNYKVDIFDTIILNSNRQKVNILETGKHYTYQYKIKFNEAFENVSLGTQFKTLKGQVLSAISLHLDPEKLLKKVKKNSIYLVKFEFKCALLQGDYFLNAGVSVHEIGQDIIFLNRIVDNLIFKVKKQNPSIISGLIDQNYKVIVEQEC